MGKKGGGRGRPLKIEAAILAGGASRRVGRDKAWLEIAGRPLIEGLASTLRRAFSSVRLIANEPARFRTLGLPVQPDLRPGSGPLGGLHAALATATRRVIFACACDLPFLTEEFLRGLAALCSGHDAVVPYTDRGAHPLCAFYSVRCLPAVERRLDRGELKLAGILEEMEVRRVEGEELARLDPGGLSLFNLNTEEDYQRARELVAGRAGLSPS